MVIYIANIATIMTTPSVSDFLRVVSNFNIRGQKKIEQFCQYVDLLNESVSSFVKYNIGNGFAKVLFILQACSSSFFVNHIAQSEPV